MNCRRIFVVLFVFALIWFPMRVCALQDPGILLSIENKKLTADNRATAANFGKSVALSGNTAVIGSVRDYEVGDNYGSAYVFQFDSQGAWTQSVKLTADDGGEDDYFGNSVAIHGQTIIAGAPGADVTDFNTGAAYIFQGDGLGNWNQIAKLTPTDGAANDQFGFPVSISNNRVIIGSYSDDDGGGGSSSAYIFEDDGSGNWNQVGKLTASDAAGGDEFGISVAISGSTAIVRSHFNDDAGDGSESAYIFKDDGLGNWSEVEKISASDAEARDFFGFSVAIENDIVVIGARREDEVASDAGAAYIYREAGDGSWSEIEKLTADDLTGNAEFWHSVAISGNRVLVGAENGNGAFPGSGSAYVFGEDQEGNWVPTFELNVSDPINSGGLNEFGWTSSISGETALVGTFI